MSYHLSTYTTHYKNLIFLGVPIIVGQLGNIILSSYAYRVACPMYIVLM